MDPGSWHKDTNFVLGSFAVFQNLIKTPLSLAIWQPTFSPLATLLDPPPSSLSPLSFTPRSVCTSRSLGQLRVGLCLAVSSFTSPFYSLRSFPNTAHLIIIITESSKLLKIDHLGVQILALSHMHAPGNPIGDQPRHPGLEIAEMPQCPTLHSKPS